MAAADQGHPTCELVNSCLRDRGAPSSAREEKALFPAQSTHSFYRLGDPLTDSLLPGGKKGTQTPVFLG